MSEIKLSLTDDEFAIVLLGIESIEKGTAVFKDDVLHMVESLPETDSLVKKLKAAWEESDA
jgi:hypothetical protein